MLDATRWIYKEEHHNWKIAYGIIASALLIAATWSLGRPRSSPVPPARVAADSPASPSASPPAVERKTRPISGRRLTEQLMARNRAMTRHYAEDTYGISFDSPRNYTLREGELLDMDTGLGYLGPIPMEFAEPGGIRVTTIEVASGAYRGTNLVNAFLTLSVFPNSTPDLCAHFSPELDQNQPALKRTIDGITFTGIPNSEAADTHEYFGKYFHGFSGNACYEIGYGIVTADSGVTAGLRPVNADALLRRLEKISSSIRIAPQQAGEDTAANPAQPNGTKN